MSIHRCQTRLGLIYCWHKGLSCVAAYRSVVTIKLMQHTRKYNEVSIFSVIYNRLFLELIFRVTYWQCEDVKAEVKFVGSIMKEILNAV